jgi:thiamine-phosphate pyrophosphorylase
MIINKNSLITKIYLISPPIIEKNIFYQQLTDAVKTNCLSIFQLRLKNYQSHEVVEIAKQSKKICHDYGVEFVLNDYVEIVQEVVPDCIHVGLDNFDNFTLLKQLKTEFKNLKLSASCYGLRSLAELAIKNDFEYLSFGPFFESKTKPTKRLPPDLMMIKNLANNFNFKSIAIGGIDNLNCKILVEARINFLAVISHVFSDSDGVDKAIIKLAKAIKSYQ